MYCYIFILNHQRKRKCVIIKMEETILTLCGAYQIERRSSEDIYMICKVGSFNYYAVFDGHGGPHKLHQSTAGYRKHVALYSAENLHIILNKYFSVIDLNSEDLVCEAIRQAFMDLDIEMYTQNLPFGTTCTCLLIDYERNKIYQANLGDSRSILFSGNDIISVTSDHDPMNKIEKSRILNAGGTVFFGRVNGELMLSRAFGDFDLKSNNTTAYDPINGMISAVPDVNVIPIIHNMFFLVTSDAPFESLDNDSLLILTNECLVEAHGNLQNAASILAKKINPKTTDDITVIIGRI